MRNEGERDAQEAMNSIEGDRAWEYFTTFSCTRNSFARGLLETG